VFALALVLHWLFFRLSRFRVALVILNTIITIISLIYDIGTEVLFSIVLLINVKLVL